MCDVKAESLKFLASLFNPPSWLWLVSCTLDLQNMPKIRFPQELLVEWSLSRKRFKKILFCLKKGTQRESLQRTNHVQWFYPWFGDLSTIQSHARINEIRLVAIYTESTPTEWQNIFQLSCALAHTAQSYENLFAVPTHQSKSMRQSAAEWMAVIVVPATIKI